MKLLVTADIHMGRIPSVGEWVDLDGTSAWNKIIDTAIEHRVDALILVGDVVNNNDLWFTVYGHILDGLRKLQEKGIRVFGVGGNHDSSVFARLSSELPFLRIIGQGGEWERFEFNGIDLIGWSFPQSIVKQNPFEHFRRNESSKLSLGLLHTDLTSGESNYAPTTIADFDQSGVDLWLLGHIHKPGKIGSSEVYYCGSPFALDRNETGDHGAYLLTSNDLTHWDSIEHIRLAPYRFESFTVELKEEETQAAIRQTITRTLQELTQNTQGTIFARLTFTGVVDQRLLDESLVDEEERYSTLFSTSGGSLLLDRVYDNETVPALNLEKIAAGSGPAALLARQILDPTELEKIAQTYLELEKTSYSSGAFKRLEPAESDYEEVLRIAKEEALTVLQTLMNQVEAP